jgi:hypothetical protein
MLILANAFSLKMVKQDYYSVTVEKHGLDYIRKLIHNDMSNFHSVVGHKITADVLETLLNVTIPVNRSDVNIRPSIDTLIVAQYTGARLPKENQQLTDITPAMMTFYTVKVTDVKVIIGNIVSLVQSI